MLTRTYPHILIYIACPISRYATYFSGLGHSQGQGEDRGGDRGA